MKVLVSPEFNIKLAALPPDEIRILSMFITEAEKANKSDFLLLHRHGLSLLGNDIYNAKIGSGRLYFTIGKDEQGDYLLLLDIASIQSTPTVQTNNFFTPNNPKTNSSLNPKLNSSINPKLNSLINPKLNSLINPKLNSLINPKLNSLINPKLNSLINPKLNSLINPKLNSSINPKLNTSLNPRFNRSYGGPYLYDLNLNQEAYIVKANDRVDLIFSSNAELRSILVSARKNVKVEFDQNNNFVGYFVRANEQVWLKYSISNEWQGLLI